MILDIGHELSILNAKIDRIPHELQECDWWVEKRKYYSCKGATCIHLLLFSLGLIKWADLPRELESEERIVHKTGTLLIVQIGRRWFKTLGRHDFEAELTFWFNFLTSPRMEDIHDWKEPGIRRRCYHIEPVEAARGSSAWG